MNRSVPSTARYRYRVTLDREPKQGRAAPFSAQGQTNGLAEPVLNTSVPRHLVCSNCSDGCYDNNQAEKQEAFSPPGRDHVRSLSRISGLTFAI